MIRIAVLDDYQGIALGMADWAALGTNVRATSFRKPFAGIAQAAEALADFDVVCLMRERMAIPRELLERLPRLKLLVFSGLRHAGLDLEAARDNGVLVCNTRGGETRHCATELTWALILAAARHLPLEDRAMRQGNWQTTIGTTLHGKTLGILGLGRLGTQSCGIAAAFGMKVLAWSPTLDEQRAALAGARAADIDTVLAQSDVVSVHLALAPQTRHLLGEAQLRKMRPTAILVNTSRGEIVDENALVQALRQGWIAGAALDVFEREPLPPGHPLLAMDNVVLTPHLGFVTRETYDIFFHDFVEDIAAFLKGAPLRVVQPNALP